MPSDYRSSLLDLPQALAWLAEQPKPLSPPPETTPADTNAWARRACEAAAWVGEAGIVALAEESPSLFPDLSHPDTALAVSWMPGGTSGVAPLITVSGHQWLAEKNQHSPDYVKVVLQMAHTKKGGEAFANMAPAAVLVCSQQDPAFSRALGSTVPEALLAFEGTPSDWREEIRATLMCQSLPEPKKKERGPRF